MTKAVATSHALQGRRLWVTRPAAQASALSALLQANGADVLQLPLLDIAPPTDPVPLQQVLANLAQFDLAIFISPSALDAVFSQLTSDWPAQLVVGVVGPGSAARAQEYGITQIVCPPTQFDGEGLMAALQQERQLAGLHIAIFRGQGGRDVLPAALIAAGAQVKLVSAYQRLAPKLTSEQLLAQLELGCDGLIVSSSEAAQHLFTIGGGVAQHRLQSVQYFAPHQRIIAALQALGATQLALTDAGDIGISRSICRYFAPASSLDV